MITETTPNLGLPLPHPDNDLSEDVEPLRRALGMVDAALADMDATLAKKADADAVTDALAETAADLLALEARTATALKNSVNHAQTFYLANTGGF